MKYPRLVLAVWVAAIFLATTCCVKVDPPIPPVPVPPQPGPPAPPTPQPDETVSRVIFASLEVGDPAERLSELPPPERIVHLQGGVTSHVWVLDEPRPGGWVRWEVHVEDDVIVASFPY